MRGTAMLMKRSRNSHIRAPRSVTQAPSGTPARIEKFEIAFFAFVTSGRWPVIWPSSATIASSAFGALGASPSPTFSTTFTTRGIWCGLVKPKVRASAGRACST